MFKPLALISAAIAFANAQDMTAIVTDASETQSGLLAYTTITTACLPAVDPNAEPIFSIQTDTVVESCTYVVNADNYSQVSFRPVLRKPDRNPVDPSMVTARRAVAYMYLNVRRLLAPSERPLQRQQRQARQ